MSLQNIRLKDYQPAPFRSLSHQLKFEIFPGHTLVHHRQHIVRAGSHQQPAVLNGHNLEIISLAIDGRPLAPADYRYENQLLTLNNVADDFWLESTVKIYPEQNKALTGLYNSSGIYCTQCEAEGFRRISFAFDRPDVLSLFEVTIESDHKISLSNGNLLAEGPLANGRYFTKWQDPHPKPTYLFALVAGELEFIREQFTSPKGVAIDLRIYSAKEFLDQCAFALRALKEAISWDEKRFNLSYDLNRFNIVAIGDFNMGAMENKSLNIFNTRCVLAESRTSTDEDFRLVHGVIAHEYFHNWTGNRITCRDWFQLSLKEGLTVFRDQEFSADHGERFIERIREVQRLRTFQFAEDAGPLAHPVQPQEYASIDNFYTATVYEKGAEIIRMYHSMLGEERFQQGMARYIKNYDGQAVRIEDFAAAMSSDFYDFRGQFFHWYLTAGTPVLEFFGDYDQGARRFTLSARQLIERVKPPRPLVIPIKFSLIDGAGRRYRFADGREETTLILDQEEGSWSFSNCDQYIPVLLADFSAPVHYSYQYGSGDLRALIFHSPDGFSRFEALQLLQRQVFGELLAGNGGGLNELVDLYGEVLADGNKSPAEKALMLELPSLETLLNFLPAPYDMDKILAAHGRLESALREGLNRQDLPAHIRALATPDTSWNSDNGGRRALQNVLRQYLDDRAAARAQLAADYRDARTMTERMGALQALARHHDEARATALADFLERFKELPLVVDKWFAVQARDNSLEHIKALAGHPLFNLDNPNRSRALLVNFTRHNPALFHAADGSGYEFFAGQLQKILLSNPQNASRMLNQFAIVAKMDGGRRGKLAAILDRLLATPALPVDVQETLERIRHGL